MKNKKALTQSTLKSSIGVTHPDLAREWHPIKNKPLTPNDISSGSHRKIWWQCTTVSAHEWLAFCKDRALKKSGCPFCSGRMASLTTSLVATKPDLAREWHPTKNGPLLSSDLVAGSTKAVWWICSQDFSHEWKATCANRALKKSGCPFCSGRRASSSNSLAATYPQLVAEWHFYKNGSVLPDNISVGSSRKMWWRCAEAHEWQATCNNRTSNKTGCPLCVRKK